MSDVLEFGLQKRIFFGKACLQTLQYSMYVACERKPLQTEQGGQHELLHFSVPPAQLSGESSQKPLTSTAIQFSGVKWQQLRYSYDIVPSDETPILVVAEARPKSTFPQVPSENQSLLVGQGGIVHDSTYHRRLGTSVRKPCLEANQN